MLRPLEQFNNLKNPSKLNMALVNIQSLKPKLDMLIHHMQVSNIDIVFVTETWTEDGNDSEHQYIKANFNTARYNMLIQNRVNRRGGGIAIIYKSHLLFEKFEKFQLTKPSMKLSKCHLFSKKIQYLGHILSTKGICPLLSKTQAIQKMHLPTTPKQVHAFLGLVLGEMVLVLGEMMATLRVSRMAKTGQRKFKFR